MKKLTYSLPILPFLLSTTLLLSACASSPPEPTPEGYYRVQRGDTLYKISRQFNQTARTLIRWNQLSNPSQLEVGQLLRVKAKVSPPQPSAGQIAAAKPIKPNNSLQLQWPAQGKLVNQYNGNSHKGITIEGNVGTPIYAAAAGKVLYVGNTVRGYGNLILIGHTSSTLTAYTHNNTMLVKQGQNVRAGEQIATMGNSDTNRAKLHFEVRINGKAVNPMTHLVNSN